MRTLTASATASPATGRPYSGVGEIVTSDFHALASHMNACQRSQGRFFAFRCKLDSLHAFASPRIVTTAAVFAVCGLGLLAIA